MIEVVDLQASEDDAWDAFLRRTPGGLVYYSTRYRDLLLEHLGCSAEYLVAREGDEIRGVMPLMWSEDPDGRICNSLPFFGSHGSPVAADAAAEDALIEAWNERATDPGTLAATMVSNPFLDHDPPPALHTLTDERISQVTALPGPDPDALLAVFTKNGRRDLRRAERRGVRVSRDAGRMAELARLHRENMLELGGRPKSDDFFSSLRRHLEPGRDFDLWVATIGDTDMAAGLLLLYFGDVAEYWTPVIAPEHRDDGPMGPILFAAMLEASRRGCRLWNWGGTWNTQDGVHAFKRKWGAQDSRYDYFVQVNDERLLEESPGSLSERFGHFYVLPYPALERVGAPL